MTTPTNDLPPFDGAVTVDTPALVAVILALSKVKLDSELSAVKVFAVPTIP